MVAGSNPNSDYNTNVKYPTEYRVEKFYPSYYNSRRPQPVGIPASLSYGGSYFNLTLTAADMFNDMSNVFNATVVLIRGGYSTHAMNMAQRMLELESSYLGNPDGTATLFVSQLPPNPAIFPPGPALAFVVVNGVPSVGLQVMIGNGQIGKQPVQAAQPLPQSRVVTTDTSGSKSAQVTPGANGTDTNQNNQANAAAHSISTSNLLVDVLAPGLLAGLFMLASLT